MRVFHIKGFSGLMMFLLACLGVVGVFILLPTSFMMVLWNAVVFETMQQGPEINMLQALPLWLAFLLTFIVIARPQFGFQFKRVTDPAEIERHLSDVKKQDREE